MPLLLFGITPQFSHLPEETDEAFCTSILAAGQRASGEVTLASLDIDFARINGVPIMYPVCGHHGPVRSHKQQFVSQEFTIIRPIDLCPIMSVRIQLCANEVWIIGYDYVELQCPVNTL